MASQVNRRLVQVGLEGFDDIDRIYGQPAAKKSSAGRPSSHHQANQNYYDHDQHDHQYSYNTYHHGNQLVSQKQQTVVITSTEAAQYYGGIEFKEYYTRKPKPSSFFSLKRFGLGF
ncbi:hypothetical protein ACOSP7_007269 [Xanthoceras sorbifolium]